MKIHTAFLFVRKQAKQKMIKSYNQKVKKFWFIDVASLYIEVIFTYLGCLHKFMVFLILLKL